MRSTAMSIVSFNGMLVKRLSTSKEIRNLFLKSKLLSSGKEMTLMKYKIQKRKFRCGKEMAQM